MDAIKNNAIGIKLHKCNVNANELSSELVAEMSENALGGPLGLDSKINTHPSTSKNKEMILVMAQIKRVSSWILKINWIFLQMISKIKNKIKYKLNTVLFQYC